MAGSSKKTLLSSLSAALLALLAGCRTPMPPGMADHGLRLGPFFETASTDSGDSMLAIRPFYSHETRGSDGTSDLRREDDILWPLGIRSRRGDHFYWRALLAYGTGVDCDSSSPEDPWRFRIFPVIFAGRTQEGENYGGLFPLFGNIRDFLVLHDFSFVLFPIYGEGRNSNGTEMRTLLWPFYLTRHGERTDQFRLWPFYGTAERRTLHSTRRSRFVAWPVWSDASSSGEIEGSGFVLFPIYGHSRYSRKTHGVEESWSVVPPLFQYARGDDGYRKLFAPWPFIRMIENGEDSEHHIWPVVGETKRHGTDSAYALWPFFRKTRIERDGFSQTILHAPLPFFFRRRTTSGRQSSTATYTRLWPFFSRREVASGELVGTFVRVPELSLWSKSEQVERNWAPLWSLYTYRRKATGAWCNDLLWGLVSWGRNDEGGAIFSLLWIPFAR